MKIILKIILILLPVCAAAQDITCGSKSIKQQLDTRVANAGTFANLRGSSDSLKVQAESILKESMDKSFEQSAPPTTCKTDCSVAIDKKVIFSAVPSKLLNEYSDKQKCEAYYKQTQTKPLSWSNLLFKSPKDLSDNFGQLSQGKGEIGSELYKKCDGDCSPQYTINITTNPDKSIKADIIAVCGPARDKDEGTYKLTTALLWECKK